MLHISVPCAYFKERHYFGGTLCREPSSAHPAKITTTPTIRFRSPPMPGLVTDMAMYHRYVAAV
ncbi:hypothetical protein CGRA01v4_14785 [Colletotrichum graminicola]|nr:hypothetical protein CGRA01v4_14785 [Colletotrichum graminicola]